MRPVSPDSCIEGVKAAMADSSGVEIRSRDACRLAVEEGAAASSAAQLVRPSSNILYEGDSSDGHALANSKMDCGGGTPSSRPLLDAISRRSTREEGSAATSAIDRDGGLAKVADHPRAGEYEVSNTRDVFPASSI